MQLLQWIEAVLATELPVSSSLNQFSVKEFQCWYCPEGTFNMSGRPLNDFYDGAFRVAIETGTPIKPVLFLDAYTRMHYRSIFSLNPGISRSLFLPEITVDEFTIEDTQLLKAKVRSVMEQALIENKAAWIKN